MPPSTPPSPDLAAGLAAAIFPGLGHIVQKRTKRGLLAMAGVMGLFLYGLMIGGIDAVDSREDRIWFAGAALLGPTGFAADWVHQNKFKAFDPQGQVPRSGRPGEVRVTEGVERPTWAPATAEQIASGQGRPNIPGLGRLNEIAMLSIALAGMLNLIVFLDALLPDAQPAPKPARRSPEPDALAAAAEPDAGETA
ncbi:MAG: DUF6677 family protein [Planctomycetota bacterium]